MAYCWIWRFLTLCQDLLWSLIFFYTDSQSTSLGMAEVGTIKLDFTVQNALESISVLEITFFHIIEMPKLRKPCLPYRHFNF